MFPSAGPAGAGRRCGGRRPRGAVHQGICATGGGQERRPAAPGRRWQPSAVPQRGPLPGPGVATSGANADGLSVRPARRTRAACLQHDSGAGHRPVFVHCDDLAGPNVPPPCWGERGEAHRSSPARLQERRELHPEPRDVENLCARRPAISQIPHRPQDASPVDGRLPSSLLRRPESELGTNDAVAGLVATPTAPSRASPEPHLFSGNRQALPELERKTFDVPELLQQPDGDFPLVVDQVVPYVVQSDVVRGGDLVRDQRAKRPSEAPERPCPDSSDHPRAAPKPSNAAMPSALRGA